MSSCLRRRYYLSQKPWISLTKAAIIFITISSSMIHGQIPNPNLNTDFVTSFVPQRSNPYDSNYNGNTNFRRPIANRGGRRRTSSRGVDLQTSFMDLFDWNKEMPVKEIINTFLDDANELPILEDLRQSCSKREFFYGQNPRHRDVVMKIKNLIMDQESAFDAIMMAGSLRDKPEVNPNAWMRGVIAATVFRDDLKGLRKPALIEVMPSMLMNTGALKEMKAQAKIGEHKRTCVMVDETVGRDNGVENELWYWREDIQLNTHHWFWHLHYPLGRNGETRFDRRGELFYFMHHTFLARYHAERLSNGLTPVEPLHLQRGTILREPYYPHLLDTNSGMEWSSRVPNTPIRDTMSQAIPGAPSHVSVDNRTINFDHILDSIQTGYVVATNGTYINIKNDLGIDLLGDIIESTNYSMNPELYGSRGFHNEGHFLIGLASDPTGDLKLPPGVMGDSGTAMRDVIFYPYHLFMDDVFDAHKRTLEPYKLAGGDWPLVLPGVAITSVHVQSRDMPINNLQTYWAEKQYDVSRGLDFNRTTVQGPVMACVKHLDHLDFVYNITAFRKPNSHASKATIRIFLAPRFDNKGRRYPLQDQRRKFFILDSFRASLHPGRNTIIRHSNQSSLTIDFPQSYRELEAQSVTGETYCGCGWPHHLLIPKGTPQGMVFDLFVMATDANEDYVPQSNRRQRCKPAPIFCGIPDEYYPDARPMGYPFDRSIYHSKTINPLDPSFDEVEGTVTLDQWLVEIPNAAVAVINITHLNQIRGGRASVPVIDKNNPLRDFEDPANDPNLGNDPFSGTSRIRDPVPFRGSGFVRDPVPFTSPSPIINAPGPFREPVPFTSPSRISSAGPFRNPVVPFTSPEPISNADPFGGLVSSRGQSPVLSHFTVRDAVPFRVRGPTRIRGPIRQSFESSQPTSTSSFNQFPYINNEI